MEPGRSTKIISIRTNRLSMEKCLSRIWGEWGRTWATAAGVRMVASGRPCAASALFRDAPPSRVDSAWVQGSGFRVQGPGSRVQDSRFRGGGVSERGVGSSMSRQRGTAETEV